jgi:hypothetical protein
MKALAGLLCVLLAGCATPQSSSPSPSPSASITFECSPALFDCSDISTGAVLTAVAGLGYPVKTVTIGVLARDCGVPMDPGTAPPCPRLPAAYVSFVGTDKIAEVELGNVPGGPGIYSVLGFGPAGSSQP